MPRYCGNRNSEHLLKNIKEFKQNCLIEGKSLLTDSVIWTSEYCEELIKYFVDNPDAGEGDFFTKLETQLTETSINAKVLIAEMLWLMFLCPSNTGTASKRGSVERVFAWSGYKIDEATKERYLSDNALTGVGSSGTAYNTMRWRELVYLIRFTESFLKLDTPEKKELLNNHIKFAQWLEQVPDNENRQLRHMLLFLFFPDFNERIFGNTDRCSILVTLAGLTKPQYNKMKCSERDAALLKLRKKFEQEFGTTELDYYIEPLKSKWKNTELNTVTNVQEPKEGYTVEKTINNTTSSLNQILYGPPGTGKTYNTINKALEIVDPDFLAQHKNDRTKIKARFDELMEKNRIGFVTFHQSFSYEDFVEGLKANSNEAHQISYEIEDGIFKRMCDAGNAHTVISQQKRPVDITGRKVWKMSLGDTLSDDAYIYQQCIDNNYVLLGYGGNIDFSSSKDRKSVVSTYNTYGINIENESNDYRVTSVHNFKNVMAIGDLIIVSDGNRKFRAIAEIIGGYEYDPSAIDDESYSQKREVIWHRVYEPSLPVDELFTKNLSQMTLYRLREPVLIRDKLKELLSDDDLNSDSIPSLSVGSKVSTYVVEGITSEIISLRKPNGALLPMPRVIIDELVHLVKQGKTTISDIRSKKVFDWNTSTEMEKYIVNGYPNVLAPLVEAIVNHGIKNKAFNNSEKRVLIIDEINRGNISNIFGELITLIEPSKRAGGSESLSVKLPYSKEPLSVPSNLHIIGTMNTADKSLAQVDIALRRRFEFVEMMPNHELLNDVEVDGIEIAKLLKTINQRIELLYDREHTIGHSFFLPLKDEPTIERLAKIFKLEILPLLEEYFFEDWERVGQVLGDHLKADVSLKFTEEKFTDTSITSLMGAEWQQEGIIPYKRNVAALNNPEAYMGVYEAL
ncbi:AAA family ATPase [Pseudoalteromonas sp. JSTW]|uniref:AAA family ATPase n=1 Tax=Pseudoalteromonas sp. JSTW TaxID=2752475 RepID=UPI0015D55BB8|nr:AAA family ATPase [Pseudoalteromonas sp. JSTW]QLJ07809.1 AAA family ATPase [Pseudoalteromonas sp. JSTW]